MLGQPLPNLSADRRPRPVLTLFPPPEWV